MRTRRLGPLALLLTLTVALLAQQQAPKATLVKAGRLLDVRAGAYRTNQGIWIDGGRIRQVGAFDDVRAAAPKDIAVIDLGRAVVLPGLIDVHTHLLDAMDPGNAAADSLILTLTKESPTKRALLGASMAREILDGGFTTVRNVGHSGVDGDVSLHPVHELNDGHGNVLPCRVVGDAGTVHLPHVGNHAQHGNLAREVRVSGQLLFQPAVKLVIAGAATTVTARPEDKLYLLACMALYRTRALGWI